jgi:signal transduction histidine kinase
MTGIAKRWRPSIAMVVAGVCITLISVPLIALLAVRLTSNQFVRETEQSLIQQSAIYSELFATAFQTLPGPLLGRELTSEQKEHWRADLHPARAILNLRADPVLPMRPDGVSMPQSLDPRYRKITDGLVQTARQAQKTNLSGVAFLSHDGRLLNDPHAPSLQALPEVQAALGGDIGRAMRLRDDSHEVHPFSTISRNTGFRVFVAYPVIAEDRIIGAIYISRTPLNLGKFLYQERVAFLTVLGVMAVAATLMGWVLVRLISRPVIGLRDEALAVAAGQKDNAAPLSHYGFRELATLGASVGDMAATLTKRAQEIRIYTDHVTHELKSPVTAIVGAAELLQGTTIDGKDREKLLENISAEGQRMSALLGRLREIARVKTMAPGKAGLLAQMVPTVAGLRIEVIAKPDAVLPLTVEHGRIVLSHMSHNASEHNATTLQMRWDGTILALIDNGDGILAADAERATDPFFTTRRDSGGTGMGLAICKAILESYDADLCSKPHEVGAYFEIKF